MSETRNYYTVAQVWLHWTIALLILFQFLSGDFMDHFQEGLQDGSIAWGHGSFGARYHMYMGILILVLASSRLTLRYTIGVPAHVPGGPHWTHVLAEWVQKLLYVFLFLTPAFGFIAVVSQHELLTVVHLLCKNILLGLVILHICGALYQIFINKQGSFKRMLHFSDK